MFNNASKTDREIALKGMLMSQDNLLTTSYVQS